MTHPVVANGRAAATVAAHLETTATPTRRRFVPSDVFFTTDHRPDWLVKGAVVRGQPMIVAGPMKTLKTGLMLDLAISIASGTPLLGKWGVPHRRRVAFVSGESGAATLSETGARICTAKNIDPVELGEWLHFEQTLPTLSRVTNVKEWASDLADIQAEVVIVDPLYLSLGPDVEPKNVFAVGHCLRTAAEVLAAGGRTLILVHHAGKVLRPGEPMQLQDMAYAGFGEFARQTILINRRAPYASDGRHELVVSVGGSAGHGGQFDVDIDEGVNTEDFSGRRWEVVVTGSHEARKVAGDDAAERKAAAVAATENRNRVSVLRAIQEVESAGKPATENAIRVAARMGLTVARRTIQTMVESGEIEPHDATAPGKPDGEVFTAYRRVEQPTAAPEDLFSEPLDRHPLGNEVLPSDSLPSGQTAAQTARRQSAAAPVCSVPSTTPCKGGRRTDGRTAAEALPSARTAGGDHAT